MNLRGADGGCDDSYHGGLSSDLGRALTSPALDHFERIYLLGFLLGGHLCLRFATEVRDPRVRSVAAVCSPLDLERSADAPGSTAGMSSPAHGSRHKGFEVHSDPDLSLEVAASQPQPIVMGRHLIELGLEPGPHFKRILDACFEAQLDGEFRDLDAGLEVARRVIGGEQTVPG